MIKTQQKQTVNNDRFEESDFSDSFVIIQEPAEDKQKKQKEQAVGGEKKSEPKNP